LPAKKPKDKKDKAKETTPEGDAAPKVDSAITPVSATSALPPSGAPMTAPGAIPTAGGTPAPGAAPALATPPPPGPPAAGNR
jgi:hypothetical protein